MSEDTKKVEQIEQEAKESEISDQDLENVAGGDAPRYSSKHPCPQDIGHKSW